MKNKLVKLISSLLVLACLISCFAVFSFAAEEEESTELTGGKTESTILHLRRTFDEGWDINNGLSPSSENNPIMSVEREELADFSYNHYAQIETTKEGSCYMQLTYDTKPVSGGSILEMDVNIKDYCNFGNVMYLRTPGASAGGTLGSPLGVFENRLRIFNFDVGLMNQGWMHVAYVMNFDQTEYVCNQCGALERFDEAFAVTPTDGHDCSSCGNALLFHRVKFRCYFSLSENFNPDKAKNAAGLSGQLTSEDLKNTYYFDYVMKVGSENDTRKWNEASVDFFRLGPGLGWNKGCTGQKIMFDNITLYSDPNTPEGEWMDFVEFEDDEYGTLVNENKSTTIDVVGGGASSNDIINAGLVLKTNSRYALKKGERVHMAVPLKDDNGDVIEGMDVGGAPMKVDGQVYVPLDPIFELTGYPKQWRADGISCDISTEHGSAVLTMGRSVAIVNGERVNLTAAPIYLKAEKSDNTYRAIALEDVETIFPGWYVTYDTMGLIAICTAGGVFDRYSDLSAMLTIMKNFVFDYYTGEEFYYKVKENTNNFDHPYISATQEQFDFIHNVWLYEEDEYKDETYKSWLDARVAAGDNLYVKYTSKPTGDHVAKTKEFDFSVKNPKYQYLYYEVTNFLECGIKDGKWYETKYDYGQYPHYKYNMKWDEIPTDYVGEHYNDGAEIETGRVGAIQSIASEIESIAFAYVITRDVKYAQLLWEIMLSFMEFRHWGQHQFLAVAAVGQALGRTFDWMYDIWTELNYDTNMMAQAMYQKIVWFGYVVTVDKHTTDWFEDKSIQPGTTPYNDMTINWNVVCTGGLTLCELAIIGEQDPNGVDRKQGKDYKGKTYTEVDFTRSKRREDLGGGEHIPTNTENLLYFTMASNFETMCRLGLNQYPPDGSFIESPGYWAYATNNLTIMLWGLVTATGDDCGVLDYAGMDTTWYFAVQSEFPSDENKKGMYSYWNFHDSSLGQQSTELFFFISQYLGDPALAAIRLEHIKAGKSVTIEDILGYKKEYLSLSMDDVVLDRDYVVENLNGVFARSEWDDGCLFTGILGDANNCTAHGQIDCGNWIYSNLNTIWFCDPGADEYDLYNYFSAPTRQHYYRCIGEGHNVMIVTNLPEQIPYGQLYNGKADFLYDEYISNEYGIKAVLDTTSLFAPYSNTMYRGLLLTNDRQTVVIQDQIGLKSSLDLAWIAHTEISDITLSDDGRTAYLKKQISADSMVHTVRVSIVEERATDLKFELLDAGVSTFLLEKTHPWGYSESMGAEPQYSRNKLRRLVIRNKGAMNFNVAVVIELLELEEDTNVPVEYDYIDMRDWVPEEKYDGKNAGIGGGSSSGGGGAQETIETLTPKDIIKYANDCKRYIDTKYAFTTRTTDFFKCLARVNNGFNSLNIDRYQGVASMQTAYANYKEYMKQYNAFREDVNAKLNLDISLTRSFSGVANISTSSSAE